MRDLAPKTLIIGGGLIGTAAAVELSGRGTRVAVLSRSISGRLAGLAEERAIELIESDVAAPRLLAEAAAEADSIVCVAGTSTPAVAASDPLGAIAGSVGPPLLALEAARQSGIKRVVIASSGGTIYGADAPLPTPEHAPLRPSSLHGVNSLTVEGIADMYRREHGLDVVVLRFSNVYGPGAESRGAQGVIAAWCRALALGHRPILIGDGEASRDFVFAADAATAIAAALTIPARAYNVGGGSTIALRELLEIIAGVSGRDIDADRRPARAVDVPCTHLDISRLRKTAGWEPSVAITEGVGAVWAWETRDL